MRRAVFLDRDGVINNAIIRNGRPYAPLTLDELVILPGVYSALKRIHDYGLLAIVITNQPDVANGITDKAKIEAINNYLKQNLPLTDIRTCFHNDEDRCLCRKPLPGLIIDAASTHNVNLKNSFMIGDRWRDVDAGNAAGCKTYFIDYGYEEKQPENADFRVKSLVEAVENILGKP